MRSKIISAVLALCAALSLLAATPAKTSKTGAKKTVTKTPAKAAPAKAKAAKASPAKASAKSTAGKKTSSAKKTASAKQPPSRFRRSTQREPAPERYREIQQSLADKGYYKGSVNGDWGPDSVAALKQFQRDQNIGDDGKLGSLSLIALGLGPKRTTDAPPVGEPHPQNQ